MTPRPLNPFAQIEQAINGGVQDMLANAVASYQGGAPFGVIFDRAPADPFSGAVDTSARTCAFALARAPGIAEGHVIILDGQAYRVAGGIEPDETGWVQLQVFQVD